MHCRQKQRLRSVMQPVSLKLTHNMSCTGTARCTAKVNPSTAHQWLSLPPSIMVETKLSAQL